MKLPHILSVVASVLFIALGVACLLLDLTIRGLRIDVGAREQQMIAIEAQLAEQTQTWQTLEEKKEWQEQANQVLRKEIVHQQTAVQTQDTQINQGAAVAQQVGPNLLRDMATASLKNAKLKDLLTKHGYTVQSK